MLHHFIPCSETLSSRFASLLLLVTVLCMSKEWSQVVPSPRNHPRPLQVRCVAAASRSAPRPSPSVPTRLLRLQIGGAEDFDGLHGKPRVLEPVFAYGNAPSSAAGDLDAVCGARGPHPHGDVLDQHAPHACRCVRRVAPATARRHDNARGKQRFRKKIFKTSGLNNLGCKQQGFRDEDSFR